MADQNSKQRFAFPIDDSSVAGFREWLFCPGMLFQAAGKWWGDRGLRPRPHEGLDLLFYRDSENNLRQIDESLEIPVMADGVVVSVIRDFLGKSIIVEHPSLSDKPGNILTFYAHATPRDNIHAGLALRRGDIIASVAGPGRTATAMTPHLHISVARTRLPIAYDELNWDIIGATEMLTLLDPLQFIDFPYRIAGADDLACRSLPRRA